jgi:hypothetical protein
MSGVLKSIDEGRYLAAVLNSQTLLDVVGQYQAKGLFGPRHFDKYVWNVGVGKWDRNNEVHKRLAQLGAEAEKVAGGIDLSGMNTSTARTAIRQALRTQGVDRDIEVAVEELLSGDAS